jgi:hypothetical protein
MRMLALAVFLLFFSAALTAKTIIFEPDDYALGTNLSNISPYVHLSTSGGKPVYASTIHRSHELAADGNPTGPLGDKVFSQNPADNSEWYYWPDAYEDFKDPGGLVVTFLQPVASFSLLFAEIFYDAGCCVSDPIYMYLYGTDGSLMEKVCVDCIAPGGFLGDAKDNPWGDWPEWPYWEFTYSGLGVGKLIVGGESEPTSIDRLTFTLVSVNEPASFALLALSLFGLGVRSRTRR